MVIFNENDVICRANALAHTDLRVAGDPVGSGLADLISLIAPPLNKNILPDLIARMKTDAETIHIALPDGVCAL